MNEKVVEVLKSAKKLISNKKHWIKNHYATDENGHVVGKLGKKDSRACKFCAVGAVDFVTNGKAPFSYAVGLLEFAIPAQSSATGVESYNDARWRTHEEMLDLFQVAIKTAKIGAAKKLKANDSALYDVARKVRKSLKKTSK